MPLHHDRFQIDSHPDFGRLLDLIVPSVLKEADCEK
jgi:hypothetical protein